ncbi:hypothetical protein HN371_25170 [Candidatus Poribacteria bacterium]|mgnify:FL=1|jgi:hypothetical protein|nr:hypothetical protein [Candidatus Poribacteria bacterium]MBT5714761.1 hypothetical protein [Candidatus Poribacteria bacterium]MBT7099391.1 hypothetical protein [Candidatus Poribacteria bacterium]MBT7809545.1 hypothetical protein [Candidatus Poribacteria bacterium]
MRSEGAGSIEERVEELARRLAEHEERMADITLMVEDATRPRVDAAPDDRVI